MNCKSMFIFAVLLLIIVTSTPFSLYAKEYRSSVQLTASLQNECSSEDGNTNCANNNAETYGDENVISPQVTQSSQTKTGEQGPPGQTGATGPPGQTGPPGPPGPSSSTDLIHVVWHDDTPGTFDTFYKRYGADFDPSMMDLSNNLGTADRPNIAVSGNIVHVVWGDGTPGDEDIFYKRSLDGGATFGATINLSDNPRLSLNPEIAISGTNVYVVWHDHESITAEIFYRRSTDGGNSFEPTRNLSNSPEVSERPDLPDLCSSFNCDNYT